MASELTSKRQRFVELYEGNGVDAARKAGFEGDDRTLGVTATRLLKNARIAQAIKARESKRMRPGIATREQRQAFWTEMMHDMAAPEVARLKASELLGKSEGDFIQRHEHSGPDGKPIPLLAAERSDAEIDARIAELVSKAKGSAP